jgi:hypothetical protein
MISSAGFIQASCFAGYEPSKPVHVIWSTTGKIEHGGRSRVSTQRNKELLPD